MPTALESAVDLLSDPGTSLAAALRKLLVVAHRIGADDLERWIRKELDGYSPDDDVPDYRDASSGPITVVFDGPMGSRETIQVSTVEMTPWLRDFVADFKLQFPVAELESITQAASETTGDPRIPLPSFWVTKYREAVNERQAPGLLYHHANEAAKVLPRSFLRGVLDRITTSALDLALKLEDVSTEVGTAGGPTVASEPALATAVQTHLTMIFANDQSTVSVASGEGSTAVQIAVGDVQGVLEAARTILDEPGLTDLGEAIAADGEVPGDHTRSFLARVRQGSYALAGGVTGNAAYDGLVALIQQAFPGFGG